MKRLVSMSVLGAVLLAAPAFAQNTTSADAAIAADKKICKTTNVTGSRLNKQKICKTRQEWDQFERDNQDVGRSMTDMKGATNGQTGAAATMGSNN